jgi:hypothetical protein
MREIARERFRFMKSEIAASLEEPVQQEPVKIHDRSPIYLIGREAGSHELRRVFLNHCISDPPKPDDGDILHIHVVLPSRSLLFLVIISRSILAALISSFVLLHSPFCNCNPLYLLPA